MASCLFLSVRDHWHEFSMATRIRYSAGAFVYMPGKRSVKQDVAYFDEHNFDFLASTQS